MRDTEYGRDVGLLMLRCWKIKVARSEDVQDTAMF